MENSKNNKAIRQPRSMYMQIILYGLILAAIPALVLSATVYNRVSENLARQNSDYSLTLLKNLQYDVDRTLNSLMYESLYLSLDRDVKYFTSRPFVSDWYRLSNVYQTILSEVTASEHIDTAYVYYPNTTQIVSSVGSYQSTEFYDLEWYAMARKRVRSNLSTIMLPTRVIRERAGSGPPVEKRVVSFVTLISGYGDRITGGVVVNVSSKYLEELLVQAGRPGSSTVVFNDAGDAFLSSDASFFGIAFTKLFPDAPASDMPEGYFISILNGNKVLVSYTCSVESGMKYVSIIPYDNVTESYRFIRWIIVLACAASLVVGTVFALGFARYIYKPVRRIVSTVANSRPEIPESREAVYSGNNEIEFVSQGYRDLLMEAYRNREINDMLRMQVLDSKDIIIGGYIQELITGAPSNMDKIDQKTRALEIPLGHYIIMIIAIDGYENFSRMWSLKEQSHWKDTVINIAKGIVGRRRWCVAQNHGTGEVLLLMHITDDEQPKAADSDVARSAGEICSAVKNLVNCFTVSVACSGICEDISLLADAYRAAGTALEERWFLGGDRVFFAPDGPVEETERATVYYPELEQKLIKALKIADSQSCFQALDEGMERLIKENGRNKFRVLSAVYQLADALCRYLESIHCTSKLFPPLGDASSSTRLYEMFRSMETLDDIRIWMNDMLGEALDYLTERYDKHSVKLVQQIQQYIDSHYMDDLYLRSVASTFNVSEYYLSRRFRQETGCGFPEYLNAIRIEHAKSQLIHQPNRSVAEVALQTGYTNTQTFVRAFKKQEGITPRQCRQTTGNRAP